MTCDGTTVLDFKCCFARSLTQNLWQWNSESFCTAVIHSVTAANPGLRPLCAASSMRGLTVGVAHDETVRRYFGGLGRRREAAQYFL
jgi:hypothetical protein